MDEVASTIADRSTREAALIRVRPVGFWQAPRSRSHFEEMAARLAAFRKAHGRAKVLVDLRDAAVQHSSNVDEMARGIQRAYVSGDRIAILTSSVLLKMQMRRVAGPADTRFFSNEETATSFLHQA